MANYISVTNNILGSGFQINSRKLKKIVELLLRLFCFDETEVSISFVGKDTIKELNSTYRKINTPTDVLSFPQVEFNPALSLIQKVSEARYPSTSLSGTKTRYNILGDIIICPEIAKKNVKKSGDLSCEIALLTIHSFLHLCGQDHMKLKDRERMFTEQLLLLNLITTINATPLWKDMVKIDTVKKLSFGKKKGQNKK